MRAYPEEFAEWKEGLPSESRGKVDILLCSNVWVRECIIRLFENVPSGDLFPLINVDHRTVPAVTIAAMVRRCINSEYFSAAAGFMIKSWHDNGEIQLVSDILSGLSHKDRDLMNQFIHLPS